MIQRCFQYKKYYQEVLRLAIPMIISQLGHTLVQTADSVIIGQYAGTTSLAAVSLVSSVFTVVLVVGLGIAYGITPLIAQEHARKNYAECGGLLATSLLINVVTGIVLFLFIFFGVTLALDNFEQSAEVIAKAKPYLVLLGISTIPLMVFNTFKQFAEGLGLVKQAMLLSIFGNLVNIGLGITFVKGLFGITPMGTSGVGYSTVIDRCIMALVMALYVLRSKHFSVYLQDFTWLKISWLRAKRICRMGIPVSFQYIFEISAFSTAAILVGTIGPHEQAAHQIAISLGSITYMVAAGVSGAAAIKSANNYGIGDYHNVRLSAIACYHIILIFAMLTTCIFIFGRNFLPWIYTSDKQVWVITARLLVIVGLWQLFDSTQVVSLGILRGIGDVKMPTIITFVSYWLMSLPVAYILGFSLNIGIVGIWVGLTLGLLLASVLLFTRFHFFIKKSMVNA